MAVTEIFDGYWLGYQDSPPGPTLDQVPPSVRVVTIFLVNPTAAGGLDTTYVSRIYPWSTIQGWIRTLQSRGQKVRISLIDSPDVHWDQINLNVFAQNVADVAFGQWGVDGVDVDGESDMPYDHFVPVMTTLVKSLAAVCRPRGKLLSYTCYTGCQPGSQDYQILSAVRDQLDWINLMPYWLTTAPYQQLWWEYARVMGPDKVCFGVKPGNNGDDQSTLLQTVKDLAAWEPAGNHKGGMMLFGTNRDIPVYTGLPQNTFIEAIAQRLPVPSTAGTTP
jgi:hypothetical protein